MLDRAPPAPILEVPLASRSERREQICRTVDPSGPASRSNPVAGPFRVVPSPLVVAAPFSEGINLTEEQPTPDEVARADRESRDRLVRSEALAALAARECVYPSLFEHQITPQLACIYPGETDPPRVLAVDGAGAVRTGPRGSMTAADVLDDLLVQNPEWRAYFGR